MDTSNTSKSKFKIKYLCLALALFLIGWGLSFLGSRLIWQEELQAIQPFQFLLGLLIPLLLLVLGSLSFLKTSGRTFSLQYVMIFFLIVSIINVLFFRFLHVRIYGDFNQLPTEITKAIVSPRWLIGSSILAFLYHSIVLPISGNFQSVAFVLLAGSILMCLFSFFLVNKYPNRLTIILPFISPIWFLFLSGYNEYYPFIAPAFICALLLLSEDRISKINPILIGIIAAFLSLLYVGFVPIGLFLMVVFFIRNGWKNGFISLVSMGLSIFLLILIFWPDNITTFFPAYYSALNVKESELFPGKLMAHLPFFKVSYAFSRDNISRVTSDFFWAGGFVSLLIMVLSAFHKKIFSALNLIQRNALYLFILVLFQVFYFIFMVPRLGGLQDIDLFFTVYLVFSFVAGLLSDILATGLTHEFSLMYKLSVFSFFLGNTSYLILYFCFLGVPYY